MGPNGRLIGSVSMLEANMIANAKIQSGFFKAVMYFPVAARWCVKMNFNWYHTKDIVLILNNNFASCALYPYIRGAACSYGNKWSS